MAAGFGPGRFAAGGRKRRDLAAAVMGRKRSVGARKNKAPRFAGNALVKNSRYLFFRAQSTYVV